MHFKRQFATALGYGERFVKAIETITAFPGKGTARPSPGGEAHVVLVYPYLLIYDFNESANTATLLRVLHGKRNIAEQLIKRPGKR